MRNLQTIENFGAARGFMTPVLAATLGGALLAGGCATGKEKNPAPAHTA